MFKLLLKIFFDEQGTTLAITRKTAGTVITAAGFNTNYDEIEAVVNALTSVNYANDSILAAALGSDVVNANNGLKQESDGSLSVDPSDTDPGLELTDGGLRAKVAELINRTASGLTWGRSGDVLFSSSTTTPTNFTDKSSTYANKMIRVSTTALTEAGSDTHTHGVGSFAVSGTTGGADDTVAVQSGSGATPGSGSHQHTFSANVTGTSASGDNVPAYVTLKMYQKD